MKTHYYRPATTPEPNEFYRHLVEKREDGKYYWRNLPSNNHRSKKIAIGDMKEGSKRLYALTRINKRSYYSHRFIFWLEYGVWPEIVDHIDGNTLNNHPSNLRAASSQENAINKRLKKRTHSVTKTQRKDGSTAYRAFITLFGKRYACGTYDTENDAIISSLFIRKLLHGERYNVQEQTS